MNRACIILFSLFMMLSSINIVCFAQCVEPTFNGKEYEVNTSENLEWLAEQVNEGKDFSGCKFRLTSNISLQNKAFTTIGTPEHPFNGIFDGRGYTISEIRSAEKQIKYLFYNIGDEGVITNLKIGEQENTQFALTSGIAYKNAGTISNCVVKADISNQENKVAGIAIENTGKIIGCGIEGKIISNNGIAAGIAIKNSGEVRNCVIKGSIKSARSAVGIVYQNLKTGEIVNCYLKNSVYSSSKSVAGIAFENSGKIAHCCVDGQVFSNSTATIANNNSADGTINDCQVSVWYNRLSGRDTDPSVKYYVQANKGSCENCAVFFLWPW